MADIAELILAAGRAGIELALFVLLPVMIVILTIMRLLEYQGLLGWVVRGVAPVLRPLGIPGLGVFAMIQILLVSFATPVATLAMVLTLAQANVSFPMAAVGLNIWAVLGISLLCSLVAAALTFHFFGRNLSNEEVSGRDNQAPEDAPAGLLAVINRAGRDAFEVAVAAIPKLVLALVVVYVFRAIGVIGVLEGALAPLFEGLGLPSAALLPIVSKYIAGGAAMMGVAVDYINQGLISPAEFNRLAGFLIHPFDLAGIAILIAAGRRVASVLKPALLGAVVGILLRAVLHLVLF